MQGYKSQLETLSYAWFRSKIEAYSDESSTYNLWELPCTSLLFSTSAPAPHLQASSVLAAAEKGDKRTILDTSSLSNIADCQVV